MRLALAFLLPFIGAAAAQIQAPAVANAGAPISPGDRIYMGDQASNTITVFNPYKKKVLGTIALGDSRLTDILGPQYMKSVNSHGLGFSRDGKHIVSLSVTSNTVTVIRTNDNTIVSQTFTNRQPHEAFFTADNRTIWVGTRGVDSISIVDGLNGGVIGIIPSPGGPSKVLFSPDGNTAYVNHVRSASLDVIDVPSRKLIHNITGLADTFSSDMMISGDGLRIFAAHKMVGKVSVISTRSKRVVAVLESGPETNHPNFAVVNGTTYGIVTVAAENATKVYSANDPESEPVFVRSIRMSGIEPHPGWPSPDNTRFYVANQHSDTMDVINLTDDFKIIDTFHIGQDTQSLVYVAGAVTSGDGTQNLGKQGLIGPVANRLLQVHPNGTALITIRPEVGVEMFQVIGRNLTLNATYEVSAECLHCGGTKIPLLHFNASTPNRNSMSCGGAPEVLAFLKFNGVYDFDSLEVHEI